MAAINWVVCVLMQRRPPVDDSPVLRSLRVRQGTVERLRSGAESIHVKVIT